MCNRKLGTAFVLSMVWAMAGCHDTRYAPKNIEQDPLDLANYPQIVVLENLHRAVKLSETPHVNAGPPMGVRVVIRNVTNDDERWIQYRFCFLDEDGNLEEPEPVWYRRHMPARTLVELRGNALSDEYRNWRLEIRPAR